MKEDTTMMNMNELPLNVQEEMKETLKAFPEVNVWFAYGEYHVSTCHVIKRDYAPDEKFIGTWKAADVFTAEEQIINYVESFHDYPIEYKGRRDYRMLNSIGNNWDIKFKMENGNIVLA